MAFEPIGEIVRLQVQREPLKAEGVYDPSALLEVDRAVLGRRGMLGWDGSAWVVDAHHRDHPRARGGKSRALSIGFTGHYGSMAERFGSVSTGIAGENIVVDGPPLRLDAIGDGLAIRLRNGSTIDLPRPRIAAPCVEFTSFLLGSDTLLPRTQIQADLAFLDEGTRGYVFAVDHIEQPVELGLGDEVGIFGAS